jgi:hypothetical protein
MEKAKKAGAKIIKAAENRLRWLRRLPPGFRRPPLGNWS